MKKSGFFVLIIIVLLISIAVCGCQPALSPNSTSSLPEQHVQPSKPTEPNSAEPINKNEEAEYGDLVTRLSVKLQTSLFKKGENTFFSPLSVYMALAMTAQGANSSTKEGMEEILGAEISDIKEYCKAVLASYAKEEVLNIANSVWFNTATDISAKKTFIDILQNDFSSEFNGENFDAKTVDRINEWVSENTDNLIKKTLDELSTDALMVLVNAILFEDKWQEQFVSTPDMSFTDYDGNVTRVPTLFRNLDAFYQTENACAFMYPFSNKRFAFMGILPNGSLEDYAKSFTMDEYAALVSQKKEDSIVKTALPTFSFEYSTLLNDCLSDLGMEDAFSSENADFTNAFIIPQHENVFISKVVHKTHVEVSNDGVKAAAVTAVIMDKTSAAYPPLNEKIIYLNRPFMFLIIDTQTQLPLFMGNVEKLS